MVWIVRILLFYLRADVLDVLVVVVVVVSLAFETLLTLLLAGKSWTSRSRGHARITVYCETVYMSASICALHVCCNWQVAVCTWLYCDATRSY